MSVENNKANERRLFDEVWNKGNVSLIPELVSPDFFHRNPQRDYKGHDGYKEMVLSQRTTMPDYHVTIDEMVGEGDKVVYRITATGTYKGKWQDVDMTGKKFRWTQALFTTYKGGKVAVAVNMMDSLPFYQQAGIKVPG
jgi:steroid delta-isomerase-like uncharacterized protein